MDIVLAIGVTPNNVLAESLKDKFLEFTEIGAAYNRTVFVTLSRNQQWRYEMIIDNRMKKGI
jgi:hypothetical protein